MVGSSVQFYDLSSPPPAAWTWDFGDGGSSSVKDPTHTFASAGAYQVTLSVPTAFGRRTRTKEVNVTSAGAPPVASFTWSPPSPLQGEPAQFSDTSSGNPTSWAWSFGDGTTSTAREVSHVFTDAGTHSVSLAVTNANGSDSVTRSVEVQSATHVPPVYAAGSRTYVIPASAHTPGVGGTSWITDVVIHNGGGEDVSGNLYFLPAGQDNTGAPGQRIVVPAARSIRLDDIVAGTFGLGSASGAVLLGCEQTVMVSSRTYNNSASGTYGQYIRGASSGEAITTNQRAHLIQLANNSDQRTNIGFANASGQELGIRVEVYRANGASLDTRNFTVEPFGFLQTGGVIPSGVDDAYVVVSSVTPDAAYFAYASVVDNRSGDPVMILPASPMTGGDVYIPAAAHAPGSGGTTWRTDLEVCNPGTSTVEYVLAFLPSDSDNSSPETRSFSLGAGQARRHRDVLSAVFGESLAVGALRASASQGEIMMSSRTYNDAPDGTFGQYIAGMTPSTGIRSGQTARLVQLARSTDFRTNIGLASASAQPCTVAIDLYGGDGGHLGTVNANLPPFGWKQVNDIFSSVTSSTVDNGFATVQVLDPDVRFFAYASVVDNVSGDPVFIPAANPAGVSEELTFTAIWDPMADLDLHVVEPSGEEIYFAHPESATGGILTRDCWQCDCAVENTLWAPGLAPEGVYTFWAYFYGRCEPTGPIDVWLQVSRGDEVVGLYTATLEEAGESTAAYTYRFEFGGGAGPTIDIRYEPADPGPFDDVSVFADVGAPGILVTGEQVGSDGWYRFESVLSDASGIATFVVPQAGTPGVQTTVTVCVPEWGADYCESVTFDSGDALANDDCENAMGITGTGYLSFNNAGATTDGPDHAQVTITRDLWYCWTPPSSGTFVLSTCEQTNIDTALAVYQGCACPATEARLMAINDDACGLQSELSFDATAGQTYLIRVGVYPGNDGGSGSFTLLEE